MGLLDFDFDRTCGRNAGYHLCWNDEIRHFDEGHFRGHQARIPGRFQHGQSWRRADVRLQPCKHGQHAFPCDAADSDWTFGRCCVQNWTFQHRCAWSIPHGHDGNYLGCAYYGECWTAYLALLDLRICRWHCTRSNLGLDSWIFQGFAEYKRSYHLHHDELDRCELGYVVVRRA